MRYKGTKGKCWEAMRKIIHEEEKDCYTCPKKNFVENGWKADCGHYRPVAVVGSNNAWSWDRRFIHLQCSRCNGAGQGMAVEYRTHLVTHYGEAIVAYFDTNYKKVRPVKNWDTLLANLT